MSMRRIPIVLDIGHSIDDFFAVAFAACSPEIELLAVTASQDPHGRRAHVARMLLHEYGLPDVPVASGPGSGLHEQFFVTANETLQRMVPDAVDGSTLNALELLDRTLRARSNVTFVLTGPFSNISAFLDRHPHASTRIKEVLFVGGWVTKALPEHNVRLDPEAAARALQHELPITLFGNEVTRGNRLQARHRNELESAAAVGPRVLSTLYETWCQMRRVNAPEIIDPIAIAYVCGLLSARTAPARVTVHTATGPKRGTMHHDAVKGRDVQLVTAVDGPPYIQSMMARLCMQQGRAEEETNPGHWHLELKSVHYLRHYAGWTLDRTSHPSHTILLVKHGVCEVDSDGETVMLPAGSALYVCPDKPLSARTVHGMHVFWFTFDALVPGKDGHNKRLDRLPWPFVFPSDPDADLLFAIAQRIDKFWWHPWPERGLLYKAAFLEFMSHMFNRAFTERLHQMDASQKAAVQARRWIEAHADEPIALDDIARAVSLSKYHLLRVFRQTFGVPPLQYHRRLRMQHARRLLNGGHLSVRAIARRVGYSSASAFSKAFKKEYGVAPSEIESPGAETDLT